MFEIGFSELVMIGLVTLLVVGPERLPKVARLAGFWLGKTRAMMASVKMEIQQELHAEDVRQLLQDQAGLKDVEQLMTQTNSAVQSIKSSLDTLPDASLNPIVSSDEPK